MASLKSRVGFADTDEGKKIKYELQRMTTDASFNTKSSYSSNSVLYPDNRISFVDKHMNYLISHPMLEPKQYLANIKLITRLR